MLNLSLGVLSWPPALGCSTELPLDMGAPIRYGQSSAERCPRAVLTFLRCTLQVAKPCFGAAEWLQLNAITASLLLSLFSTRAGETARMQQLWRFPGSSAVCGWMGKRRNQRGGGTSCCVVLLPTGTWLTKLSSWRLMTVLCRHHLYNVLLN